MPKWWSETHEIRVAINKTAIMRWSSYCKSNEHVCQTQMGCPSSNHNQQRKGCSWGGACSSTLHQFSLRISSLATGMELVSGCPVPQPISSLPYCKLKPMFRSMHDCSCSVCVVSDEHPTTENSLQYLQQITEC